MPGRAMDCQRPIEWDRNSDHLFAEVVLAHVAAAGVAIAALTNMVVTGDKQDQKLPAEGEDFEKRTGLGQLVVVVVVAAEDDGDRPGEQQQPLPVRLLRRTAPAWASCARRPSWWTFLVDDEERELVYPYLWDPSLFWVWGFP